jgi:myo-inositol-1(or 4)-monophosphatase
MESNPTEASTLSAGAGLLALERAVDLGSAVLRQGRSHVGALIAKGDRDFATTVDLRVEQTIKQALTDVTPEIPFLGEEMGGADLEERTVWVLDPIDGTVNFARDSPLCGISLALIERRRPTLGIIDLPFARERYIGVEGAGAYVNGRRLHVAPERPLHEAVIGFADFSVGPEALEENRLHLAILRRLAGASLRIRSHGSAALDLAWLACGRLDATIMLSNLPWDVSAGVLIVREAGGVVYDHDGSEHMPSSRFTLASTSALRGALVEIVARAQAGELGPSAAY